MGRISTENRKKISLLDGCVKDPSADGELTSVFVEKRFENLPSGRIAPEIIEPPSCGLPFPIRGCKFFSTYTQTPLQLGRITLKQPKETTSLLDGYVKHPPADRKLTSILLEMRFRSLPSSLTAPEIFEGLPFPFHAASKLFPVYTEKRPQFCPITLSHPKETSLLEGYVKHPPARGELTSVLVEKPFENLPSGRIAREIFEPHGVGFHFPVHAASKFSSLYTEKRLPLGRITPKQPSLLVPIEPPAVRFPFPIHAAAEFTSRCSVTELSSLPSTNMEKLSKTRVFIKLKKLRIRQMLAVKKLRIRQTWPVKKQYKKSHQGNGWKKPFASRDFIVHEKISIQAIQPISAIPDSGAGPSNDVSSMSCIEKVKERVDLLRKKLALMSEPKQDVTSDHVDCTYFFCWVLESSFLAPHYSQISGECCECRYV